MTSGVLCLDKPADITSFSCCAIARRLLSVKKVGHAGTLDPMATGVLPLLFGTATRALPYLETHDKAYTVTMQFGKKSDTLDIWGTVEETGGRVPTREEVEAILPRFRGEIRQIPPMTSALKKDGVRLYQLAREGIEVEREERPVTIRSLTLDDLSGDCLTLSCTCSQGTYMRTLADDLAHALGTDAVMTALRRTMAAGFSEAEAVTLEEAKRLAEAGTLFEKCRPTDSLFSSLPSVRVSEAQAKRFQNGGELALDRLPKTIRGRARVYAPDGVFLGIGETREDSLFVLKRF